MFPPVRTLITRTIVQKQLTMAVDRKLRYSDAETSVITCSTSISVVTVILHDNITFQFCGCFTIILDCSHYCIK